MPDVLMRTESVAPYEVRLGDVIEDPAGASLSRRVDKSNCEVGVW
ncbi:hypothetical protein ACFXG4_50845 [Nocardia sp. NPDC059246]